MKRLRIFAYLCCVGLCVLFAWAGFVKIEIATNAPGEIIPTGKVRVLQHLEGGIIKKINVDEGLVVNEGDIILEFEEVESRSEVDEIETRLAFLRSEIVTHNALLNGASPSFPKTGNNKSAKIIAASKQQFDAMKASFDSGLAVFQNEIIQNTQIIKITKSKLAERKTTLSLLERQEAISADLLTEQLTSELEHLDILRAKQSVLAEISDAEQNIYLARSTIDQLNLEIEKEKYKWREEISNKLQIFVEEEQKYSSRLERFADALGRRFLTSPVDGTVKKLHVQTIGGVVKPGTDIVEIVPLSEKLIIEARLPVQDIGFVSFGQPVIISLAGDHGKYFESIEGSVTVVSPDSVKTNDGEMFYPVRIETEAAGFVSGQEQFFLYPGMSVDCAIVIGDRSLLENILAPFFQVKRSAFRENVLRGETPISWGSHLVSIFNPVSW